MSKSFPIKYRFLYLYEGVKYKVGYINNTNPSTYTFTKVSPKGFNFVDENGEKKYKNHFYDSKYKPLKDGRIYTAVHKAIVIQKV